MTITTVFPNSPPAKYLQIKNKKKKNVHQSTAQTVRWERFLFPSFWLIFFLFTFAIVFESWIVTNHDWCHPQLQQQQLRKKYYSNPDSKFASNPCYTHRTWKLLYLTPMECDFGRRILAAIVYGAAIGFERKAVDRPVGIRTMSLVSLGSAVFTMCSQFAFLSGTQEWDAARVSAAIPSGVGFLGSAFIWKEAANAQTIQEEHRNQVHGLTTAASVWLSASVGIGAGGALYLYSTWAVVLVVFVLRLGPRLAMLDESGETASTSYTSGEGGNSDWETGLSEPERGDKANDPYEDEEEIQPMTRQEQLEQLREVASSVRHEGLSSSSLFERHLSSRDSSLRQRRVQVNEPEEELKSIHKLRQTGVTVSYRS